MRAFIRFMLQIPTKYLPELQRILSKAAGILGDPRATDAGAREIDREVSNLQRTVARDAAKAAQQAVKPSRVNPWWLLKAAVSAAAGAAAVVISFGIRPASEAPKIDVAPPPPIAVVMTAPTPPPAPQPAPPPVVRRPEAVPEPAPEASVAVPRPEPIAMRAQEPVRLAVEAIEAERRVEPERRIELVATPRYEEVHTQMAERAPVVHQDVQVPPAQRGRFRTIDVTAPFGPRITVSPP